MGLLDNLNISIVDDVKKNIKRLYLQDNIPWIIGYSGGKDSTCTTQIIIDSLIDLIDEGQKLNKKVFIISSDTMVETPMIINIIEDTINRINRLSNKLHLPIEASIVKPLTNRGFWANLIGRGYPCPNQTFRWCTDRMKIEPSNRFTQSLIEKYGEVIMVLGVREGESNSRDRVLETHTIEGKDFMRHTTQANSYVYAPIRQFSKDDVWNYLLTHKSPWGTDNKVLFELYQDSLSGEECPIMMSEEDKKKTTCGNSRFGCWVCTVVTEDKSLTGFIKSGVKWLKPLLEYRNWLVSIRDDDERRMKRRVNGSIYFSKINIEGDSLVISAKNSRQKTIIKKAEQGWIDNFDRDWNVFLSLNSESDARNYIIKNNIDLTTGANPRIIIKKIDGAFYQLGLGPFNYQTRKEMLKKLLETQKNLSVKYKLITKEELKEIQKLWFESGDIHNSVSQIYYDVYSEDLELENDDIRIFSEDDHYELERICKENGFNYELFSRLLNIEKDYSGFANRVEALKNIKESLNQEFLTIQKEGYEDAD